MCKQKMRTKSHIADDHTLMNTRDATEKHGVWTQTSMDNT